MHLKNFSLWHKDGVTFLTPAYDLLNTTLVLGNANEESALPIGGKKRNLTRKLWIDYYCHERLGLSLGQVGRILEEFSSVISEWHGLIQRSFLSNSAKLAYLDMLSNRNSVLNLL